MKVGLILECGPVGADAKVIPHLIDLINKEYGKNVIYAPPVTLGDNSQLMIDCGGAAKRLLETDNCDCVVIIWDLDTKKKWRKGRCLGKDRKDIFASLNTAKVDLTKVRLIGIKRELEAWLIADGRALRAFLLQMTGHDIGRVTVVNRPEQQTSPKAWLNNFLEQNWGRDRKYIDREHAELIVKQLVDLREIKKCPTFKRFIEKLEI